MTCDACYRLLAASDFYRVNVLVGGTLVASSAPATPVDSRLPGEQLDEVGKPVPD